MDEPTDARNPDPNADARHAHGVDPEIKESNRKRLRRIEGQIRGIQRMVEEDRYCPDILTQIQAVQSALSAVGRQLVRNHLRHCVTAAVHEGGDAAEQAFDEIVDLFRRAGV